MVTRRLGDRVRHWITINEPWEVGFLGYHQGVNAPGRRDFGAAIAAVHTVLLAHGAAVPVIRANVPGAQVGITLDPSACYPASAAEADVLAARRLDGHLNRWFLDPVFGRGYPADLVDWYGPLAPVARAGRRRPRWVRRSTSWASTTTTPTGSGPTRASRRWALRIVPPSGPELTDLGWLVTRQA